MVLAHDTSVGKRTSDVKISHDVTFDTMLLAESTMDGLRSAGFYKPSPIQLHGIPLGKCGFDLLLEAKSGTGKTAVFTVIALEKLDLNKGLQSVILAPTREIAAQICDVIKQIGVGFQGLGVEVVMGGLPIQDDIAKFKSGQRVHILVGSPGRLRHLIHDNHVDTSSVRLLVLDEADKLVESSFQADINYIFSVLPKQKQVILSSATYPEASKEFISKYVHNSQHVCPDSSCVLMGISQKVTVVTFNSNIVKQTKLRYEELLKLLTKKQFKQCLIFCNYQARVTDLHRMLTRDKWPSEQLYGLQLQTDRLEALRTLQEYKCRILISTDLAARGIDASNVDLVVNFEPPFEWQTYLHRIGRAGRYGSYGTALTILSQGKEETRFKNMLSVMEDSVSIEDLWTGRKYGDRNSVLLEHPDHNDNIVEHPEQNGNKVKHFEQDSSIVELSRNNIEDLNGQANSLIENNSNQIFNELWKELSTNAASSSDLENFEELYRSFDQCKIDTFSDLLDSYESTIEVQKDFTSNSEEYNCISLKDIRIQDCIKHLSDHSAVQKICVKDKTKEEPINVTNNSSVINEHIDRSFTPKVSSPTFCKKNRENHENAQDSLEDEEVEMIRLGLPTSFWSKQNRNKQKKSQNRFYKPDFYSYKGKDIKNVEACGEVNNNKSSSKTYIEESSKVINDNIKDTNPTSDVKSVKQKPKHKVKTSTKVIPEIIKLSNQSMKQKQTAVPSQIGTPLKASRNFSKDTSKKCNNNQSKKKCFHTLAEYTHWYTMLKLKTQQIEMALYLQELSNM